MQKKKEVASEELDGELGTIFNFTGGDLAANQAGFLSHRQKEIQKQKLHSDIRDYFWLVLGFEFLFLLGTAMLFSENICEEGYCMPLLTLAQGGFATLTMFGLCIPPTLILVFWAWESYFRDTKNRRIQKLVGQISSMWLGTGTTKSYVLYCSEKEFKINKEQSSHVWKQTPYTVYYLPHSKQILSIEEALPE